VNSIARSPSDADAPIAMRFYGSEAGWNQLSPGELWDYRELFWALAMRDFKVRYRQAAIGIVWAILQPVLKLAIFYVLFVVLQAKPTTPGSHTPFLLIGFAGILLWEFFASIIRDAGDILVNQRHMITKIYFPRIILPCSVVITACADTAIGLVMLAAMMLWYQIMPSVMIMFTPLYLCWLIVVSLSAGILLSCLNALYRDIRFMIPFVIQIGFLISATVYEYRALVKNPSWDWLLGVNPLITIIEGFRASLFGTPWPTMALMIMSLCSSILLIGLSLKVYLTVEQTLADRV
jgi:lipopolysaccharide transport system permease protein